MVNYQNGKIYRLFVEFYDDEKQPQVLNYIGSTTQALSTRLGKHKSNYNKWIVDGKPTSNTNERSVYLFEKGNPQIVLITSYSCNNKEELHKEERKYIEEYECVNKVIPSRTPKEYYEANKDYILKRNKEYSEAHREEIAQYKKTYNKQYDLEHSQKIKQRKSQPYKCICGSICRYGEKSKHFSSKIHNEYLQEQLLNYLDLQM